MTPEQKRAHERLQEALRDRIRTHWRMAPEERRRGPGFMADPKGWGKVAHDRSPMRGRKA